MATQGSTSAATKLRTMLLNDDKFRAKFADDPAGALREVGIDIPADVTLPKLDKQDLEDRVKKLKAEFGAQIEGLFAPADVGPGGVRAVTNVRLNTIGSLVVPNINRPAGVGALGGRGTVYTISVCGTADW